MAKTNYEFGHATRDDFYWFINERHRIWCLRDSDEPEPWTSDPILQKYKFTNIFRELDRGTLVLRHMIAGDGSLSPADIVFVCFWYRLTGKWETLQRVGLVTTPEDLQSALRDMYVRGETIYTSAYMTTGKKGISKWRTTVETMQFVENNILSLLQTARNGCLEILFEKILDLNIWGVSKFLAYEVVSDLRHYPQVIGDVVHDAKSWANIGPGCKRGLERLGMPDTLRSLRILYSQGLEKLDDHVLNGVLPFEMREIEHSLCEFDKYQRALTGAGRPKQLFHPQDEFIRP